MCTIRNATNADKQSIYKVNADSVREVCSSCYSEEDITPWISRLHPSMYEPFIDNGTMKVVMLEDEVVACGCLEQFSDTTALVCCLYVSPSMARKGIGRLILGFLESEAKAKNYECVRLESSLNAEGFYSANGFQVTQRDLLHFIGDHQIQAVLMTKTL